MKKITIGRNNVCDIIIPDTTDMVSRKQAILTYSFWGKMVLYDTSNNGTYVNGQKLENGKGIQVTRKDKVNFARIADLDWNEVKDPYRQMKWIVAAACLVIMLAAAILTWWLSQPVKEDITLPTYTETPAPKGETTTTIVPQVVESPQPVKKPVQKAKGIKVKKLTPKEIQSKEVNENTPIVY